MIDAQEAHRTREKFQAEQREQIARMLEAGQEVDPIFLSEKTSKEVKGKGKVQEKSEPAVNGLKRKSPDQGSMAPPSLPRKVAMRNGHKRSRTVDGRALSKSADNRSTSDLASTARYNAMMSSPRSSLWGSTNSSLTRSTSLGRKLDRTQTDYFRLKARGIDPGTPIFPETKTSLERKKRSISDRTATKSAFAAPSPDQPTAAPRTSSVSSSTTSTPKTFDPEKDEFLQQIRQVSRAMKEDSEWFNSQTKELEKEIEAQEAIRSRQNSPPTTNPSPDGSGLASVNGYLYSPTPLSTSTRSISRTEQRIRRTGAHGFATRPVSDYLAVAQSKTTSNRLSGAVKSSLRKKRKTKTGERDGRYIYSSDEDSDEEVDDHVRHALPTERKRKKPTPESGRGIATSQNANSGHRTSSSSSKPSPDSRVILNGVTPADADEGFAEDPEDFVPAHAYTSLRGADAQNVGEHFEVYDDTHAQPADDSAEEDEEDDQDQNQEEMDSDVDAEADHYVADEDAESDSDDEIESDNDVSDHDLDGPAHFADEPLQYPDLGDRPSTAGSASFHMRLRSQSPQSQAQMQSQRSVGGSVGSPAMGYGSQTGAGASVEDALVLSD